MECEREAFLGESKRKGVFRLEVIKMHCIHMRNCQKINENINNKSIVFFLNKKELESAAPGNG